MCAGWSYCSFRVIFQSVFLPLPDVIHVRYFVKVNLNLSFLFVCMLLGYKMYHPLNDKCPINFVSKFPTISQYTDSFEKMVGVSRDDFLRRKLRFERVCEDVMCPMYRVMWLEGDVYWEALHVLHKYVCTLTDAWWNSDMSLFGEKNFRCFHDPHFIGDVGSTLVHGCRSAVALRLPEEDLDGDNFSLPPLEADDVESDGEEEKLEKEKKGKKGKKMKKEKKGKKGKKMKKEKKVDFQVKVAVRDDADAKAKKRDYALQQLK